MPLVEALLPELERYELEWKAFAVKVAAYEAAVREGVIDEGERLDRLEPPAMSIEFLMLPSVWAIVEPGLKRDGYATAYQLWLELASRVLRVVDVGEIAARLHADRLSRLTGRDDDAPGERAKIQRDQNAQQVRMAISRCTIPDEAVRAFWTAAARRRLAR
ncbi:MAG: hypothetical protein NT062_16435 [Proteobacteria bacterium]|nr:hypothetical protein [Pseudomonadota bacterium]